MVHRCRAGRELIQLLGEWMFPRMQECKGIESVYEQGIKTMDHRN